MRSMKDTRKDIEVGAGEGLQTIQVSENRSDNFLDVKKRKMRKRLCYRMNKLKEKNNRITSSSWVRQLPPIHSFPLIKHIHDDTHVDIPVLLVPSVKHG